MLYSEQCWFSCGLFDITSQFTIGQLHQTLSYNLTLTSTLLVLPTTQTLHSDLIHMPISSIPMPTSCWEYSVAKRGKQFGFFKGRLASSLIVMASWKTDHFGQASLLAVNIKAHLEGNGLSVITRAARVDAILLHNMPSFN